MGGYIPMMERGLLEGLAKGREKGVQNIILNMLKNKVDISTIMKITKVTEDKILQIQKKLQV